MCLPLRGQVRPRYIVFEDCLYSDNWCHLLGWTTKVEYIISKDISSRRHYDVIRKEHLHWALGHINFSTDRQELDINWIFPRFNLSSEISWQMFAITYLYWMLEPNETTYLKFFKYLKEECYKCKILWHSFFVTWPYLN